jgi:hypothetical protein
MTDEKEIEAKPQSVWDGDIIPQINEIIPNK